MGKKKTSRSTTKLVPGKKYTIVEGQAGGTELAFISEIQVDSISENRPQEKIGSKNKAPLPITRNVNYEIIDVRDRKLHGHLLGQKRGAGYDWLLRQIYPSPKKKKLPKSDAKNNPSTKGLQVETDVVIGKAPLPGYPLLYVRYSAQVQKYEVDYSEKDQDTDDGSRQATRTPRSFLAENVKEEEIKQGWPPALWNCNVAPIDRSPEAIEAWLELAIPSAEQFSMWARKADPRIIAEKDATDYVEDAWLLVKELKAQGWPNRVRVGEGSITGEHPLHKLEIILDWMRANRPGGSGKADPGNEVSESETVVAVPTSEPAGQGETAEEESSTEEETSQTSQSKKGSWFDTSPPVSDCWFGSVEGTITELDKCMGRGSAKTLKEHNGKQFWIQSIPPKKFAVWLKTEDGIKKLEKDIEDFRKLNETS